jgi:hypothetical protein
MGLYFRGGDLFSSESYSYWHFSCHPVSRPRKASLRNRNRLAVICQSDFKYVANNVEADAEDILRLASSGTLTRFLPSCLIGNPY